MKRVPILFTLILAIVAVIGSYLYVTSAIETKNNKVRKARPEAAEQAIKITVIDAQMGAYTPTVTASGLVTPRYSLILKNEVSGTVNQVSDLFESGQVVKKGDLLIRLDNKELQSNLASAKNDLASADLALKEEKRQGEQARAEWEASGFSEAPDSDLVLREPQLIAAQAEYDYAKVEVNNAQSDLRKTRITAPFDALVIQRDVSPGSYLSSSSQLGTLYSVDRAEIKVDLSDSDWSKLSDENTLTTSNVPVAIEHTTNNNSWIGRILHVGLHIDPSTRMRSLTIGLDKPLEQSPLLIPGTFVKVSIQGKQQDGLWRLPNTALSQKSEIWYLNENSRLSTFETTPLFVDSQYIYVRAPDSLKNNVVQVLVQPYNSYLEGSLVSPIKQSTKPSKADAS